MNVPCQCISCGRQVGDIAKPIREYMMIKRKTTNFTQFEPMLYPLSADKSLQTYHDNREIFDAFCLSTNRLCCVNTILCTVDNAANYGFRIARAE